MEREPVDTAIGGGSAPLYLQVRREIMSCLASGEWKIGQRLPTERELADRWGVAISTVRAGVSQLVAAGVLSRRQGRGTFVAPYDSTTTSLRFSNIYDLEDKKVATVRTITRMREVRGDLDVRKHLRLESEESVWHLGGLLRSAGDAIATIDVFLPKDRFAELKIEDIDPALNLYAIYQRSCGVTVLRMEERVHARVADDALARRLNVSVGSPLLYIDRIGYTFEDQPVELRRRFFEGTHHHYFFKQDRIE